MSQAAFILSQLVFFVFLILNLDVLCQTERGAVGAEGGCFLRASDDEAEGSVGGVTAGR